MGQPSESNQVRIVFADPEILEPEPFNPADLFNGLTEEQKDLILKELRVIAKRKHEAMVMGMEQLPHNVLIQKLAIAWEFICQNLKLAGYDWS